MTPWRCGRARAAWIAVLALLNLVAALPGAAQETFEGTWSGRFAGLGREQAQIWVNGTQVKLFTEWPGGQSISAQGDIRSGGVLRTCGTYQRSQQGDNLCIDGTFAGDRFTGQWSTSDGKGSIELARAGGAPAAAAQGPWPGTLSRLGEQNAQLEVRGKTIALNVKWADGTTITAGGDAGADGRFRACGNYRDNRRNDNFFCLEGKLDADLAEGRWELGRGESDRFEFRRPGAARAVAAPTPARPPAAAPPPAPAATSAPGPARNAAGQPNARSPYIPAPTVFTQPSAPVPTRPLTMAVGDFILPTGERNEALRHQLLATLQRFASTHYTVVAHRPETGTADIHASATLLSGETSQSTDTGRAIAQHFGYNFGSPVRTQLRLRVQVTFARAVDGIVLAEIGEYADRVANSGQASTLAFTGRATEDAVTRLVGRLATDRRDFLVLPQPAVAEVRSPSPREPPLDAQTGRAIQSALKAIGLYNGAVDGQLGSGSQTAIRSFQQQIGEQQTGRLSNAQIERLQILASRPQAIADASKRPSEPRPEPRQLSPVAVAIPPAPSAPPPAAVSTPAPAAVDPIEMEYWSTIKANPTAGNCSAYLQTYPRGRFAPLARACLEEQKPKTSTAPALASLPQDLDLGQYHALVIGNVAYADLPKLETAIIDAEAVAALLERQYGFSVKLMRNATRVDILNALRELRETLKPTDNLLIYYAGHGYLDTAAQTGYWLPVDADRSSPSNWIANSDLTTQIRAMQARHVLIVADSCYSGTLVRRAEITMPRGEEQKAYLRRLASKKARKVLASGGIEPVLDGGGGIHSVFAKAFLDVLRDNDSAIDGQSLFTRIRRPVAVNSDQTPEYSDIRMAGDDGGDFIFLRKSR